MKKIKESLKDLGKSVWGFTMTLFGETMYGINKLYDKIKWKLKK